jgi:hypothetical protein
MKIQKVVLTLIAAAALSLTGCSKSSDGATGDVSAAPAGIDTSKIQAAFASADEATKKAIEPVITAVKNADYAGAVSQLKALGEKFKLTDEQQAEVNALIEKAQKAIKDMADKATGEASKAAGDLGKAIGK